MAQGTVTPTRAHRVEPTVRRDAGIAVAPDRLVPSRHARAEHPDEKEG